ncbi:hypothetical protein ABZ847_07210 [Streptomyces bauhiniae]
MAEAVNRQKWMLWSCATLLVGVVAVVVGMALNMWSVWPRSDSHAAAKSSKSSSPYAYVTRDQVVVMNGSRAVHRQARRFNDAEEPPRWTADGAYLYFLRLPVSPAAESDALSRQELVSVNSANGRVRTYPCPHCTGTSPLGAARVLAYQSDSGTSAHMLTFDLRRSDPPIQFRLSSEPRGAVSVLTGFSSAVLLAVTDSSIASAMGGPQSLYVLDGEGQTRSLGMTKSDQAVSLVAADRPTAGRTRVAMVTGVHASACETRDAITVIDVPSRRSRTLDMSPVVPVSSRSGQSGLAVRDLWFDARGRLTATVTAWRCNYAAADPVVPTLQPSIWRLDENHWVEVAKGPVGKVRPLPDGTELSLAPRAADVTSQGAELWSITDNHRRLVAQGVLDFSLPSE